jgi:hypothetical protein
MYEDVDWKELAQERDQWWVLVETAMNHKHRVILRSVSKLTQRSTEPAQSMPLVAAEPSVSSRE